MSLILSPEGRKPIFDAAKARGATFRSLADVAVLDRAIDEAIATLAAPPAPVSIPVTVPVISTGFSPIETIDAALLKIACPENTLKELALWIEPVKAACRRWGIDTLREVCSFLANIGVESAGLTRLEENLNYSAKRMAEVWPGRFAINPGAKLKDRQPNALAQSLSRNPEKLANHVYANRMGNGPPESGDGWRHRGYGPKQLTGKSNHRRFAEAYGVRLEDVPALLQTKEGGMHSAGWFWFDNGMDALAATAGVEDDRQRINGGQTGVDEVRKRFNALIAELLKREKQAGGVA
jgi:putative chitinase